MVSEPPPLLSSFPLSPIRIIIYIIMLCLSFLYYAFLAEASRLVILPHILIPPFLSDLLVSLHPPPSRNLFCLHLYISCLPAYAHFRCFYTHWLLISVPPMDPLRFVLYTNFFFAMCYHRRSLFYVTHSHFILLSAHLHPSNHLFTISLLTSRTIQARYSITNKLCCHLHAALAPHRTP